MNIDDDNQLWGKSVLSKLEEQNKERNKDFYDQMAVKTLWPDAFAKAYNKEIDEHEEYTLSKEFFTESKINDIINPKHYKNVAAGKQYMELMVDMLANKSGVEAHLFGQVYKYLMRCGNKDDEVQELEKALWYLTALIKYKKEGVVL